MALLFGSVFTDRKMSRRNGTSEKVVFQLGFVTNENLRSASRVLGLPGISKKYSESKPTRSGFCYRFVLDNFCHPD